MKTRAEISQETYEQALKLAQHLPNDLAAELKEEAQARFEFEQQAVEKSQKFTKKRPLVIVAILVLALVAAVAVGIYAQSGRFQIVQKGEQLHQAFEVQSALESKEQKNIIIFSAYKIDYVQTLTMAICGMSWGKHMH